MMDISTANILVVDIGGTSVKIGCTTAGIPHHDTRLFPSETLRRFDPISALTEMISDVVKQTGSRPDLIVATVPGFLDVDEDTVLFAANIRTLNGRRLATELSAALHIPVILERDSVLALMGETIAGVGRGGNAVLGIYFGTGVGAAFIMDGRPFRGAGWALEIGNMPFRTEGRTLEGLREDGLETYVSGRALQTIADQYRLPIQNVFDVAQEDPHSALAGTIDKFVTDQAVAVGIACTLFSPDILVLGGGVCEMSGFPKAKLASMIERRAPFDCTSLPMDLRWAELGWRGVLHGAPLAAVEHFRRHPKTPSS